MVRIQRRAHEAGAKQHAPVTDATLAAHVGDARPARTSVAPTHDDAAPGTYRGTLRFAHAGKETFTSASRFLASRSGCSALP